MNTPLKLTGILIAIASGLVACHKPEQSAQGEARDWWFITNAPVIAFWDGGNSMAHEPPSAIFVLWSDGMFVRSKDKRLHKGHVSTTEIRRLMSQVESAGFFSQSGSTLIDSHGLTRPDGPVRCLAAVRDGKIMRRYYDGYDDFKSAGPYSSPSRAQMEAFARMWEAVVRTIDTVASNELVPFRGERTLTYPHDGISP